MISDVVITGYLTDFDKRDNKYRHIEYRSTDALNDVERIFEIPLLFWTRMENNILNNLKKGTFVVIRGRVEMDENVGLYILVENVVLTGEVSID